MAKLVYVGATSHVSGIVRTPDADPRYTQTLESGWAKMSDAIAESRPDIVVMISTDHQETYGLENYPVFCMGEAEEYPAWNEHGIPGEGARGIPEISAQLRQTLISLEIDISVSMEMPLDHGYIVPLQRLKLGGLPIVPLFINCNEPPLPTLRRCRTLGRSLRAAIDRLPDEMRVAVVATGGVSHWVAVPRQGEINEAWDARFLDLMAQGELDVLENMSDSDIIEEAGNGALEVRTWIAAMACAGGKGGEVLAYAPMYPWVTGIGIFEMKIAS